MRKVTRFMSYLLAFALVMMFFNLSVAAAPADKELPESASENSAVVKQYILFFEDDYVQNADDIYTANNVQKVKQFHNLNGVVIRGTEQSIAAVSKHLPMKLMAEDMEISIETNNALVRPDKTIKDPKPDPVEPDPVDPEPVISTQVIPWGIERVMGSDIEDYNDNGLNGNGVNVAIIDTGIDLDHPELIGRIIDDVTFIPRTKSGNDDHGHGTHVSGIIGAADNTYGVRGIAPEVNFYAVKVLDRKGSGYVSYSLAGLDWCLEAGRDVDVINMSLGSDTLTQDLIDAYNLAFDQCAEQGIIVAAAAGNDEHLDTKEGSHVDYPGILSGTIAVGAVMNDSYDTTAYFSSEGPEVEIYAPGYEVYSTYKDGNYTTMSGTSMATPHVAGVAALYKQLNPNGTIADFRVYMSQFDKVIETSSLLD